MRMGAGCWVLGVSRETTTPFLPLRMHNEHSYPLPQLLAGIWHGFSPNPTIVWLGCHNQYNVNYKYIKRIPQWWLTITIENHACWSVVIGDWWWAPNAASNRCWWAFSHLPIQIGNGLGGFPCPSSPPYLSEGLLELFVSQPVPGCPLPQP